MTTPILEVENLSVAFGTGRDEITVVEDVSFTLEAGTTLGLVGESGSGKSVTSLAVMGLIHHQGGRITNGSVRLNGKDLVGLSRRDWRSVHGSGMGMVFQQPTRSLDPSFTVGEQVAEALRSHRRISRSEAWSAAVDMLRRVDIPDPERRARDYPHMFSGGMAQRVMIAMALICRPQVLIADEPTTALDVTVQSAILDLIVELQEETSIAVLFISHDLGVIAEVSDRVAVMYAGQIVEEAATNDLLQQPQHPYALNLLESVPQVGGGRRLATIPGRVPPMAQLPEGCRFHPRCRFAVEGTCTTDPIPLLLLDGPRSARCVRTDELFDEVSSRGIA